MTRPRTQTRWTDVGPQIEAMVNERDGLLAVLRQARALAIFSVVTAACGLKYGMPTTLRGWALCRTKPTLNSCVRHKCYLLI